MSYSPRDDAEPAHICGNCAHFVSADISAEEPYHDVGVCCMRVQDKSYAPSECVVLWSDRAENAEIFGCENWAV